MSDPYSTKPAAAASGRRRSAGAPLAFTTRVKRALNRWVLAPVNLELETLTARRRERERLERARRAGHFDAPAFPPLAAVDHAQVETLLAGLAEHRGRFESWSRAGDNDTGFEVTNDYFGSPDAEVLYAMIRRLRPATLVEVGCGNSTRVARQACIDGALPTRIVCVDPRPRRDVTPFADVLVPEPVEHAPWEAALGRLAPGDVLFVDSSHEVRIAGDVAYLFLQALPKLPAGVVVHVHDVFLPYDYPVDWVFERGWTGAEHYLLQALLGFSDAFEILWPGYWLQRSRADFADAFPWRRELGRAQSFWFRRRPR